VTDYAARVVNTKVGDDLVEGVKEMKVAYGLEKARGDEVNRGKDRVSFGSNMSNEEETLASDSR
jgi:hypothetical protein